MGLPDNTGDDDYLATLEIALERALFLANADIAIYVSGADPFVEDTLGKLSLTKNGLAERDRMVFGMCHARHIPVAVSMGGGYAKDIKDIVDIHYQTIQIAHEFSQIWQSQPVL